MGQIVSRRILATLERMRVRQEELLTRDAMEEIERRKVEAMKRGTKNRSVATTLYTDPNARLVGYTRGQQYQRVLDNDLEKQVSSGAANNVDAISRELLQFLNDTGPIDKKLNDFLTSNRVLRAESEIGDDADKKSVQTRINEPKGGAVSEKSENERSADTFRRKKNTHALTDEQIIHLLLYPQGQLLLPPTLQTALQTVCVTTIRLRENQTDDDSPYIAGMPDQEGLLINLGRVVYPSNDASVAESNTSVSDIAAGG